MSRTALQTIVTLSWLAVLFLVLPASAQPPVPVTVTFDAIEIFDNVCDEDPPEVCPNDKFILVNIGSNIPGNDFVRHDFPDNVSDLRPARFSTSRVINLTSGDGRITIDVEVWDRDDIGPDDKLNIQGPNKTLRLTYDLTTGAGGGEGRSAGTGADSVTIIFRLSSEGNDVDGDGIPDNLEVFGLRDASGNMIMDLPGMGASPRRKDVFVEVDCMVSDGNGNGYSPLDPLDHSHCPSAAALRDVVQAFANAPVPNLDGTQGVQLHLDVGTLFGAGVVTPVNGINGVVGNVGDFGSGGTQIPEVAIIDWDGAPGNPGTSFYTLKAAPNNFFNAARSQAFRYAIFGHQTNARAATNDCTSGWAEGIPGNDFMVTLGGVNAAGAACYTVDANGFSVGSRAEQAGTFMHELGHILGLHHGGNDDINNKPNYLSVMNYNWQPCTVPPSASAVLPGFCDYSRIGPGPGGIPDLDETSLDECAGLGTLLGFGAVNWNGDAVFQGATCAAPNTTNAVADTNNDGVCITFGTNNSQDSVLVGDDVATGSSLNDGPDRVCNTPVTTDDVQVVPVNSTPIQPAVLKSFNDWGGIVYNFRDQPNFANGVASPVPDEPDADTLRRSREYLSLITAPDVQITKSGPATILPGQTVTWTTDVRNVGRGPALAVVLTDTSPGSAPVVSDLGLMVVGRVVTTTSKFTVAADACPTDLVSTARATYEDLAAEELASSGRIVTRVLDIVPPKLTLALSQNSLWPPNHKLVTITASITVTDDCDPNPKVRLVSITSNEPDNGLGDGNTAGDVQGAAIGTDDRTFQLRAERSGRGTGRVYTVTYEASDASGNTTTQQATVSVPHSKP